MERGGIFVNNKLSPAARREENWGWIMVAPTIIGLVILNLWPFVQTIYTAFCEHLGFGRYQFVGLANFTRMFQNEIGRASCRERVFYSV